MKKKIFKDYELKEPEEDLEIVSKDQSSKPIVISDFRKKGISTILIRKNTKVLFKSYFDTKKIFFLEKNAELNSYDLGKNVNLEVSLLEENSVFNQKGLLIGDGDWKVIVKHQTEKTSSNVQIKNLVDAGEFSKIEGIIKIDDGCPKASGNLEITSLLLSDSARVYSLPILEISTDDVSCTHSASVTKLDQEEIFYLMSRGLSQQEAEDLLIKSFKESDEIIEDMISYLERNSEQEEKNES